MAAKTRPRQGLLQALPTRNEGGSEPARHHRKRRRIALRLLPAAALGGAMLLAGCSSLNPAGWFHRQEGGVVATAKPPPGLNKPYPNLATVPPAPPPADLAALQRVSNALISDQQNAQHEAAAAPLADPSLPSASPALFGVGTVPPPPPGAGQPVAAAAMAAATAAPSAPTSAPTRKPQPEAPAAPPKAAPVTGVHSAQLAAPAPTVPAAPPPRPAVAAAAAPPQAPAQKSSPPPNPPPAAPASAAATVTVDFAPQSASLPAAALPALRALAGRRGNHLIEAVGYGDAPSAAPDAQQAAVKLGLARATSIAAALQADGVPRSAIRVSANAGGRGGAARLLD